MSANLTRIGSLFSGYGGLDMGVRSVLGGTVAWHSEIEPAPSRVLAHHWPDVPNLGDITTVDFRAVEPIDVLTGGFPCQDVSHAGKRAGLTSTSRSGLWAHMARAIDELRPRLVVAENVRGLLSADADSDVEPCPWCVGDGGAGRPLRALGAVLGDLADLGYDAAWCGVRAADVGAPHGRFRVFITAWPAPEHPGLRPGGTEHGQQQAVSPLGAGESSGIPTTDAPSNPWGFGHGDDGPPEHPASAGSQGPTGGRVQHGLPGAGRGGHALADASGDGRDEGRTQPARLIGGPDAAERGHAAPADTDGYGQQSVGRLEPFGRAIRRWERVLGRDAPAPTEAGPKGGQRLSPRFVEFLMGLPAGHVTAVPGLSRNDQLKALGNGVVPQQAAEAVRRLLLMAAERAPACTACRDARPERAS